MDMNQMEQQPNGGKPVKEKKPLNKTVLYAGIAFVAVLAVLFVCFGMTRKLEVENTTCYVGEPTMPVYSGDGLDSDTDIDSIEYEYDSDLLTVDEDNKLVANATGDAFDCTMIIKSGSKRWKGKFTITTSYKAVSFSNGAMPLGNKTGSCPLKITNSESGQKCYVYFKNNGSGSDFAICITGGSSIDKKVPTGSYTMYVAYGYVTQDWYGTKYLFGKDGNKYYKRAEALSFTVTSYAANGYTITMTDSTGGQVNLQSIDYEDFPGAEK